MHKYYNTVLKTVLTLFFLDHVSGVSIFSILFLVRSRKDRILILFSFPTTILLGHFDFGCEIFDATILFRCSFVICECGFDFDAKIVMQPFFQFLFSKIKNPLSWPTLVRTATRREKIFPIAGTVFVMVLAQP